MNNYILTEEHLKKIILAFSDFVSFSKKCQKLKNTFTKKFDSEKITISKNWNCIDTEYSSAWERGCFFYSINGEEIIDEKFLKKLDIEFEKNENLNIKNFMTEIHALEIFIHLNPKYKWNNVFCFEKPDFLYVDNGTTTGIEIFQAKNKITFEADKKWTNEERKIQSMSNILNSDSTDEIIRVFKKHFNKLNTYIENINKSINTNYKNNNFLFIVEQGMQNSKLTKCKTIIQELNSKISELEIQNVDLELVLIFHMSPNQFIFFKKENEFVVKINIKWNETLEREINGEFNENNLPWVFDK